MFKKIYIDLDGVLADFFLEWKKIIGKEWWELDNNQIAFQKIRDDKDFWLRLPMLKNGYDLLCILKKHNLTYGILSSPLQNDKKCRSQKTQWVKNMLSFYPPSTVIISNTKEIFAKDEFGRPNLLIDDYGLNIRKWEQNGGIGIKHKDHKYLRTKVRLESIIKNKYENLLDNVKYNHNSLIKYKTG